MSSTRLASAPSLAARGSLFACTLGVGGCQGKTILGAATLALAAGSTALPLMRVPLAGSDVALCCLGLSLESRMTLHVVFPPSANLI